MSRPELVFRSDELEVVLLPELGGRIHRLRAFGTDLLRTPPDPAHHADDPFFWGAYVMAPWCNRAQTGPMQIAGRTVDLAANFADGSAIHGQVSARPWAVHEDGSLRVAGGGGGWPWPYEVVAYHPVGRHDLPYPRHRSDEPCGGSDSTRGSAAPVALRIPATAVYPPTLGRPRSSRFAAPTLRVARSGRGLDGTCTGARHGMSSLPGDGRAQCYIEVDAERTLVASHARHLDAVAVEPRRTGPLPAATGTGLADALPASPGRSLSLTCGYGRARIVERLPSRSRHRAAAARWRRRSHGPHSILGRSRRRHIVRAFHRASSADLVAPNGGRAPMERSFTAGADSFRWLRQLGTASYRIPRRQHVGAGRPVSVRPDARRGRPASHRRVEA